MACTVLNDEAMIKRLKGESEDGLPITEIDLSKSKLGSSEVAMIASLIVKNPHLTHLNLSHNMPLDSGITFKGMLKLFDILPRTNITHLDLSHCNLTNFGNDMDMPLKLAETLPKTKITHLNLAHNQLEKKQIGTLPGNLEAIVKLSEVLPSTSIETLDLSTNRIQDGGVDLLTAAFKQMEQLKTVDLTDNTCAKAAIEKAMKEAPMVAIKG